MICAAIERCAGIDVGKKVLAVCTMTGTLNGEPRVERRRYGTFTADLESLRDWLKAEGVTHAVMECTGSYWKPVFNVLEEGLQVCLANPQEVKNRKGHKTAARYCPMNQALAEALKEHVAALCRLTKIPGINLYAAQELVAESGAGAEAFPSPEQFASWVGVCPGSQQTAGVNYSHRSAKGNRYLRRLLCQIAWAAIHTKDTFFAGLFARLKPKVEGKGAAWAVAHRVAKLVWMILHEGVEYVEKGTAPLNPRTLVRKFRRLVREFGRQGIDVESLLEQELAATS